MIRASWLGSLLWSANCRDPSSHRLLEWQLLRGTGSLSAYPVRSIIKTPCALYNERPSLANLLFSVFAYFCATPKIPQAAGGRPLDHQNVEGPDCQNPRTRTTKKKCYFLPSRALKTLRGGWEVMISSMYDPVGRHHQASKICPHLRFPPRFITRKRGSVTYTQLTFAAPSPPPHHFSPQQVVSPGDHFPSPMKQAYYAPERARRGALGPLIRVAAAPEFGLCATGAFDEGGLA